MYTRHIILNLLLIRYLVIANGRYRPIVLLLAILRLLLGRILPIGLRLLMRRVLLLLILVLLLGVTLHVLCLHLRVAREQAVVLRFVLGVGRLELLLLRGVIVCLSGFVVH